MKRRVTASTILISTVFAFITGPNKAFAAEFNEVLAINDSANEVVDTAGWTHTYNIDSSVDSRGFYVKQILKGWAYHVEVNGTFTYAAGNGPDGKPARFADAECSIDPIGDKATGRQWQQERFQGYYSDLLDLLVWNNGSIAPFEWTPVDPYPLFSPDGEPACSKTHTYFADIQPSQWYLMFNVDDRYWRDNIGSLQVTLSRGVFQTDRIFEGSAYQCPKWTMEHRVLATVEKVGAIGDMNMMIDSERNALKHLDPNETDAMGNHLIAFNKETGHFGMYTCNWALPDTTYRIVVDGVWKYQTDEGELALADAECATGSVPYESKWASLRSTPIPIDKFVPDRYVGNTETPDPSDDVDHLDLQINWESGNNNRHWIPMYPDPDNPACAGDADHTYFLNYTPDHVGPIRFNVGDWQYNEADNHGMLCIDVTRAGLTHHDPESKQHSVLTVSDFIDGANIS